MKLALLSAAALALALAGCGGTPTQDVDGGSAFSFSNGVTPLGGVDRAPTGRRTLSALTSRARPRVGQARPIPTADGVSIEFENGNKAQAPIMIGADGVRSVIRQALYGDDNPTYTGQMVWRALLNGSDVPEEVLEPTGHIQWVGPGCHLLAYYIRGKKLVNIVTQEDTDKWVEEGWSTRGDPDEMRLSFPNPEPRLEKLLSLVTECSKWGLFTRPLTQNWGRGRIQLIGDAALTLDSRERSYRLFREQGYEATTVEQIAEAAEVSVNTVYNYFPTKEDLVYWRLESFERLRPLIRAGDPLAGTIGDGVLWGKADLLEAMPPYQGGGSMIHIHARTPDGIPSYEVEDFRNITDAILAGREVEVGDGLVA